MALSKNLSLRENAYRAAMKTKRGRTLTGETIRLRCEQEGIFANSPNQWGGVVGSLIRQGVLTKTDEFVPMTDPNSNGRTTRVYTRETPAS